MDDFPRVTLCQSTRKLALSLLCQHLFILTQYFPSEFPPVPPSNIASLIFLRASSLAQSPSPRPLPLPVVARRSRPYPHTSFPPLFAADARTRTGLSTPWPSDERGKHHACNTSAIHAVWISDEPATCPPVCLPIHLSTRSFCVVRAR